MFAPHFALILAAVLLAGCGATQESSTSRFSGEQERVAQVVEDLQSAGEAKKADDICGRLLAPELVDRMKAGSRSCADEVGLALDDADEFTLDVQAVTISGSTATARVEDGDGRVRTLELVRQGADWKVSSL